MIEATENKINKLDKYIRETGIYGVEQKEYIREVDSMAYLLRHKKTGARTALLLNDDDNKVFSIGFRTPVSDSTGVPHIIEHTVLCGSEKYPLKDPFMELVKGSLNTFINAMTYPDKTVYPVASCNDKDFKNLMSVYMDAVFHPNIYREEKIFRQEGWRYEMDDADDDLKVNGIVYNEMKGVFSSVDGILGEESLMSLFPDNGYQYVSGGDPKHIPELKYEDYLKFHSRYYHPSNSYIYLYGDMDMAERLSWMDSEYLSRYEFLKVDSEIPHQDAFDEPVIIKKKYSAGEEDTPKTSAVLAENFAIEESGDAMTDLAIQVIDYAIMQKKGAPLKTALIKADLGKDVSADYDNSIRQTIYSIAVKYGDAADEKRFIKTVDDTLLEIENQGIDKKALLAGLNSLEFKTREADTGSYPKGLIYGLDILSTWLYDDENVFSRIKTDEIFEKLRANIDTGYYEDILRKYFIDNKHRSILILEPEAGLSRKEDEEQKARMAKKKSSLSGEEIDDIVKKTAELRAYQNQESTSSEKETIPLLELSDIDRNPREIIGKVSDENGFKVVHTDIFTNDIGYVNYIFDFSDVPKKYIPYLGLLRCIPGALDTENYTYDELNSEIDMNLGGFGFSTSQYSRVDQSPDDTIITAEISTKALKGNLSKIPEYISEILLGTRFTDRDRIREILEEEKSRIYALIQSAGDQVSRIRAYSYYKRNYKIMDMTSGIGHYEFLKDLLDDFDNRADDFIEDMKKTIRYAFRRDRLILSFAGDEDTLSRVKKDTLRLLEKLPEESPKEKPYEFVPKKKNEAFITPGQVQFVAKAGRMTDGNLADETIGTLHVLSRIMRSGYLWDNIRVLGGAYGCSSYFENEGSMAFTSYRDPNLKKTVETYDNASEFVRNFDVEEREMRKYIIGTISGMDRPLTAADRCDRELEMYLTKRTYDSLKTIRENVLLATPEAIRSTAHMVERAMNEDNICVVGSRNSINECSEMFKDIKNL